MLYNQDHYLMFFLSSVDSSCAWHDPTGAINTCILLVSAQIQKTHLPTKYGN